MVGQMKVTLKSGKGHPVGHGRSDEGHLSVTDVSSGLNAI